MAKITVQIEIGDGGILSVRATSPDVEVVVLDYDTFQEDFSNFENDGIECQRMYFDTATERVLSAAEATYITSDLESLTHAR